MIPAAMSDEVNRDSEPYVAVDPANPQIIAATAFLRTPAGSMNGPLLVSTDGGANWSARNVIPSNPGDLNTYDVTIRFNPSGTAFYAALLRAPTVQFEIHRTTDLSFNTPLQVVYSPRRTDQPYIFVSTVPSGPDAGDDRLWVGNNENAVAPASATVDQSFDAGVAAPGFGVERIDFGAVVGRDNYQVRPAAHPDGHVYVAFYRRKGNIAGGYNADVVVVRDDDWGQGGMPFRNLVDTVTLVAGQNVEVDTPVSDTFGSSVSLGREWWGGDLYLTVDPVDSGTVYVSYSDSEPGLERTLHLQRSTDFGQTWNEILTTPSAKNAAVAINAQGTIGYLYQQLAGTAPSRTWQTHLRRSADGGASWDDLLLAEFPAEGVDSPGGSRIVGDYLNMVAVGKGFYGVFSSYNDPAVASFPAGIRWQRNVTAPGNPMPSLLGVDGVTPVSASIDPFFFSVVPQPQIQVPGPLGLGGACAGSPVTASLDVCNTGQADLTVTAVHSSDPQFAVTAPSSGFPVTVSHDFCFPFQVVFDAASSGAQSATLTVDSDDPDNPSTDVAVSGEGREPDVRLTGSGDFGVASAWDPAEKTFSLCNVGGCPLDAASAAIDCADFSQLHDPLPAPLAPGSCLDLIVGFTPQLPGHKSCNLTVTTDDPDSPMVMRPLDGRTPPYLSLHTGLVNPHGSLGATVTDGSTFNLDLLVPFQPAWAWDVRLGLSRFDGKAGQSDVDLASFSANARFTVNPGAPLQVFLNAGPGIYHFDPGNVEGGANAGLGLFAPLGSRFALEATYDYHSAFTASPNLEFSQVQLGLMIAF